MTDLLNRATGTDRRIASLTTGILRHRAAVPTLVGLLGLVISLTGIGIPSIWYDEAATISAVTRSPAQLWEMIGNVDAVHGVFYFATQALVEVFGASPLTIRVPSALAVGAAAALTVLLARQFGSDRLALLAGVIFCLLPRTTWMGTEGRSYALTAALAVLLTIVFVRASHSLSRRWWLLYGALAVAASLVFVFLALVVFAHGVSVAWWLATTGRAARRVAIRWSVTTAIAAAALVPFALTIAGQAGQLSWIGPLGKNTVRQVFRTQWFVAGDEFAVAGWALFAVGLALLLRRGRGFTLATAVVPALIVPTAALLVATAVYTPLYTPRYLSMCLPFVAIVMATAVAALPSRRLVAAVLVALLVLAVPQIVRDRLPEAKQHSSWSQVADLIDTERARDGADTTTAIIYGPVRYHATATSRVIAYSYPGAFDGTIDVTLGTPAAETGELWETRYRLDETLERLDDADVAYLITSVKRDRRAATTEALAGIGWRVTATWGLTDVNVLRYERG